MAQGRLSGYAWHIQKIEGTSKKRRNCFNCINYCKEDHSCNAKLIPITNNNARYCSNYKKEESNDNVNKGIMHEYYYTDEEIKKRKEILDELRLKRKESQTKKKKLTLEESKRREASKKRKKVQRQILEEYHRKLNKIKKLEKVFIETGSQNRIEECEENKNKIISEFKNSHADLYLKDERRKARIRKRRLKRGI